MSLFSCASCKSYEKQLLSLRAQLTDQHECLIKQQQAFEQERAMLLDKLLAVTSPAAVRELNRPSYNSRPKERRPVQQIPSPFSVAPAPRPPVAKPRTGRLAKESDKPAQSTPEEAAAEIAGG
jgi:hypothetical protein